MISLNGVTKKESYSIETIEKDIDFSGSSEEDTIINLGAVARDVVRGRLYITSVPSTGFVANAKLTFYNKATMKGRDATFRASPVKLVYTQLEVATSVGSPNITPDDHKDFKRDGLALILGSPEELVMIKTVADTLIAEDNIENVHPINTGLVRIASFSSFILFNNEEETNVYCRITFLSAETVSLKLELILKK